jgi:hypothetical protein
MAQALALTVVTSGHIAARRWNLTDTVMAMIMRDLTIARNRAGRA